MVSGVGGDADDRQPILGQRVKLELNTSFSGKDQLTTALRAGNLPNLAEATGTNMARLGLQGNSDNQVELNELTYRFPVSPKTTMRVIAVGGSLTDFAKPLNSFLDDTGEGAISRFAQRNPIFRQGSGSGVGITHKFNGLLRLSAGYLANDANDPTRGFSRESGAIAQITLSPRDRIDFALTYVRSHNSVRTGTGSRIANDPFRGISDAIVSNSFGLQSEIGLTSKLFLSSWVGFTQASATDLPNNPQAYSFNWAATLAVPDLGGNGNLLGLAIGQPPKVTQNDFIQRGRAYVDSDTSLHLKPSTDGAS
ncbi:MAG: carbohydrate porin [Leptolyngbyaceae cyanobacterium CSU_1_3]|nr:carbohydrate porin [Leptolyngbyaceae cyanobacterium CSU_1_3]